MLTKPSTTAGTPDDGASINESSRVLRQTNQFDFTAGKREVRSWTIKRGTRAPQAAGKIHTDFERGFIRAEVTWWEDRVALKTEAACRSAAKTTTEGKEYVVRDGDVMYFRFNV